MSSKQIKYWALFANFYDVFKNILTMENLSKAYNLGMEKLSNHQLAKDAFEYFYNLRKEELFKKNAKEAVS